jgi:hypothetical protein
MELFQISSLKKMLLSEYNLNSHNHMFLVNKSKTPFKYMGTSLASEAKP